MLDQFTHILIEWMNAHNDADSNTSLLKTNHTYFVDLCAAKMKVVHEIDKLFYSLKITETMPKEVIRHLEANINDTPCYCGGLSVRSQKHPECIAKSKEFFDSKTALLQYIRSAYT